MTMTYSFSSAYRALALVTFALTSAGCSDAKDAEAPEEDPGEHACEHRNEPGTTLEASSSSDDAPLLEVSEEPYSVTLPEAATDGTFDGYVRLSGPGDSLLFAGTDDVVSELRFGTDGPDELPEAAPNEFCPEEIPAHFDLELSESGDYFLRLGPSAESELFLVHLSAEGHAH
jgi:hypothetical protein